MSEQKEDLKGHSHDLLKRKNYFQHCTYLFDSCKLFPSPIVLNMGILIAENISVQELKVVGVFIKLIDRPSRLTQCCTIWD